MTLSLTLGPIQYNWPAEDRLEFYRRVADSPVDTVVLGETVCFKRTPFLRDCTLEAASLLADAGKQVVFATLALAVSTPELKDMQALCAAPDGGDGGDSPLVEANDAGAMHHLRGRAHWIGPFVNTYNPGTLAVLAASGATQVCLPWELGMDSVRALAASPAAAQTGLRLEVPVFGRVPLAISARCYHARAHGLSKDGCQYICDQDPDGMEVETLEGESFLRVNGVQTLSGAVHVAIHEVATLARAGVSSLRLMPEEGDMAGIITAFRRVADGQDDPAQGEATLRQILGDRPLCNGFLHGQDGTRWIAA